MAESKDENAAGSAETEGGPTGTEAPKTSVAAEVEDVPDPDEDDLDDLDDMLDDFSAVKIDSKKPEVPTTGPGRPEEATKAPAPPEPLNDDVLSDEEFAKQLQAGMADLLGDLQGSPEMQAQFESIFKELGQAAAAEQEPSSAAQTAPGAGAGSSTSPNASEAASNAEASFQETIRRTMERMQASGDQATAAATAEGSDDFMAELLKQMQSGGGLEGEGNEEFSKMLLGMMEQLTNKDILYEPMKELNDKFPEWMTKNKDTTSKEDMKRFEEQRVLVKEIVAKFEESTYSDTNKTDREYIVDRMQKMQAAGAPPHDLVGDMPSAQDALNLGNEEGCNPQ